MVCCALPLVCPGVFFGCCLGRSPRLLCKACHKMASPFQRHNRHSPRMLAYTRRTGREEEVRIVNPTSLLTRRPNPHRGLHVQHWRYCAPRFLTLGLKHVCLSPFLPPGTTAEEGNKMHSTPRRASTYASLSLSLPVNTLFHVYHHTIFFPLFFPASALLCSRVCMCVCAGTCASVK